MTGGFKTSAALSALFAASGMLMLTGASASAADLGGNCCADLEERIAELESTTARKGNRKVSLTISGWVHEAVFFWDDGVEQNMYVGTNSLEQSRFKLAGEAKIVEGWSAGYTIELGINGAASNTFSQVNTGSANSIGIRKSSWFVKSKTYGKLTVGQDGTATYHLLDDADGVNTRNYSDAEAASVALGQFRLRSNGAFLANNRTWQDALGGFNNRTPGQNGRRNVVRYDSPELAGFTVTAAWGEDDMWDAALTYKGEVGDFKLVGKLGYGESTDSTSIQNRCTNPGNGNCQWWGVAGTVMHKPTGLFVYGGYGSESVDGLPANVEDQNDVYFVQAGIEQKWLPLGKTTVFGEYRKDESGFKNQTFGTATIAASNIRSSDIDNYALGVVQNVEAAAMDFYVIYRHTEGDIRNQTATINLDDFDMVITGARIQF